MKKLILIIMLCGLIFGQNQNSSKKDIQDKKGVWLVGMQTKYLDLSTEQAEKFFPLQREFHGKIEEIKKKQRDAIKQLDNDTENPSKADFNKVIEMEKKLKIEAATMHANFLTAAQNILNDNQMVKLLLMEEQIKDKLSSELNERKNNPRDMKRRLDRYRKNNRNN